MTYDSTTISPHVTLGHPRDSRASRVPTPTPTPTKTVQQPAGLDLWEEPEKGPEGWDRPAAARLHEEPGASRRPPGVYSDQEFRRLCKLVRAELRAHADLEGADLMEHLKCACAARRLAYDSAVLGRVLDIVRPRERLVQRHAEPSATHWRDRCAHTPRCTTPTACALRAAKEGR
jgi:hypothetical protein